jgi:hypothetical protein
MKKMMTLAISGLIMFNLGVALLSMSSCAKPIPDCPEGFVYISSDKIIKAQISSGSDGWFYQLKSMPNTMVFSKKALAVGENLQVNDCVKTR